MSIPEKHHVPVVTAAWMIVLPVLFWFFGGAGAGTVFDWIAQLLRTMFAVYGGPSLLFGFILLGWTAWTAWRGGDLVRNDA